MRIRQARKLALQVLFSAEFTDKNTAFLLISEVKFPDDIKNFAKTLVESTFAQIDYIDNLISQCLKNWQFSRLSKLDKNILRLAVGELLSFDTPVRVVINEAIELAKEFSDPHAYKFINGVLDKIANFYLPSRQPTIKDKTPQNGRTFF